ncbi:putative toxin-antitoxin system toxin component, PIN family [Rhizobium sp. LjRoot254]
MRVVVDTNVFVGACIGRGASSRIIEACIREELVPLMSSTLFLEYEDVLARHEPFVRARLDQRERTALLEIFLFKCRPIAVHFLWRPNLRDEADNHLVELAVAGNADAIVTHNTRDFSDPQLTFQHLRVLKPEQLVQELGR